SVGEHEVIITATDSSGNVSSCSFTVTVDETLGIEEDVYVDLRMYPNPASTSVTISNPNSISIDSIKILDILGRNVMNVNIINSTDSQAIDISSLPSAVYMVLIQTETIEIVKRLIIE